jgi:hypothetical protein
VLDRAVVAIAVADISRRFRGNRQITPDITE